MEKLEVVSPIFLLEKQIIIALKDKVIVESSSPIQEYRVEYQYDELKPRVVRGRWGDSGWVEIGNNLLLAAFLIAICSVFLFRGFFESPYYRVVVLGLAALSLVAYVLRLIKYDKVWIEEKDGRSGISITLTKQNREAAERVISYIAEKLEQVESKPTSQAD